MNSQKQKSALTSLPLSSGLDQLTVTQVADAVALRWWTAAGLEGRVVALDGSECGDAPDELTAWTLKLYSVLGCKDFTSYSSSVPENTCKYVMLLFNSTKYKNRTKKHEIEITSTFNYRQNLTRKDKIRAQWEDQHAALHCINTVLCSMSGQ